MSRYEKCPNRITTEGHLSHEHELERLRLAGDHAKGGIAVVAGGDNNGGSLVSSSVANGVVGVDGLQKVERLSCREAGLANHLLDCSGITLCNLVAVLDVRLTRDGERFTVGCRLGNALDSDGFTVRRGGLLCLLGDGDAVVGDLQLLGEFRVVDDDLEDLEAVARDGFTVGRQHGILDGVAVGEDVVERNGRSLGFDLIADECLDGVFRLHDLVDRRAGFPGDDPEEHHDRQDDHLVVCGLHGALDVDAELLQVDAVHDLLEERDDQVEAGADATVVAAESLDDADLLLLDDLGGHHQKDDQDAEHDQKAEVGEDACEEVADEVQRVARAGGFSDADLLAVLCVPRAVLFDTFVVRHIVKPLGRCSNERGMYFQTKSESYIL